MRFYRFFYALKKNKNSNTAWSRGGKDQAVYFFKDYNRIRLEEAVSTGTRVVFVRGRLFFRIGRGFAFDVAFFILFFG